MVSNAKMKLQVVSETSLTFTSGRLKGASEQRTTASEAVPSTAHTVRELVRITTAGSVDDGKSTLIGRLLLDTGSVYDDVLSSIAGQPGSEGIPEELSLALLTDGLKAEREQGITIDVAYRYFSTDKRRFILADAPGHEQYTRNMATAASTADVALILVDAARGVTVQTKRHAFIADLLGVPRFIVVINKMDIVGYAEEVFEEIKAEFTEFASKLHVKDVRFIPVSALLGENVIRKSELMPWYHGDSILHSLDEMYVAGDINRIDFRFPLQGVMRGEGTFRAGLGNVVSGSIKVGEEVVVLPSHRRSRIKALFGAAWSGNSGPQTVDSADAPAALAIQLEDEIDLARGHMIVRPHNTPTVVSRFEAMVVWLHTEPMVADRVYLLQHTTRETKARIEEVRYQVDVRTLSREGARPLEVNEICRLVITVADPLFVDSYRKNRSTGNFILIDSDTCATVGAGMILDISSEQERSHQPRRDAAGVLHPEAGLVGRGDREARLGGEACTVWFTGLSGSGKSTLAKQLEAELFESGIHTMLLDGDTIRHGLCSDLGFDADSRKENIRRVSEVCRLLNDAGVTVLCAFVTPFEELRQMAREIIGERSFVEVYVSTPLEVCEGRDPHGLYARARKGEIADFTGVSSPYEPPHRPAIEINTENTGIDQAIEQIRMVIPRGGRG